MSYFAMTIDPLHVGAGGYRLGRVDNTIIREPGTNLPKVPATSISGVCRNYSIYGLENNTGARECAKTTGGDTHKEHCGECPICRAFGYAKKKHSHIGIVKFFDAQIIAFPVSTILGPVWVSCPSVLRAAGGTVEDEPSAEELVCSFALQQEVKLNLGWLYLPARPPAQGKSMALPDIKENALSKAVADRLVLAPDWLFPEVVNANLEVRTSVSIDFDTGAAKDGALFTYEAIPRATLLAFDVEVDAHRCSAAEGEQVRKLVHSGLGLLETLGMGGMNTRGFGRMKVLGLGAGG